MSKQQRCDEVNAAIQVIGAHGRRFFYSAKHARYARCEVDPRGKVWFVDDHTGKRVYTHAGGFGNKWRGFSHGGTLRDLVERFRDYIARGDRVPKALLGIERSNPENGNIWGYEPAALERVRAEVAGLPVFS